MDNIKAQIQTIIDAAKELTAGGESIHNVYGEMSISLERLAKLVKGEGKWKVEDWDSYILTPFLNTTETLVKTLYNNQKEIRLFLFKIVFLICVLLGLIYFIFPLIKNSDINLSFILNSYFSSQVIPTYWQESNNFVQLSIAISTFLAVLVALFSERLWRWIERPKIRMSFDKDSDRCFRWADISLCNIQDEGQIRDVRKYYFRLKVLNIGKSATKLRVRADIMDENGKEVERFEPSTLQWINGKEETDLLNGESEYVNFLSQVVNHPEVNNRLTIEIFNTSPRGIAWDRKLSKYKYSITVFGENIKPISLQAAFVPNRNKSLPGNLFLS